MMQASLVPSPPVGWSKVPLWTLIRRVEQRGRGDAERLSVYRDLGVVRTASRDDNFNKPGEDLEAYKYVHPGDLVLNKMKTWQGSLGVSEYSGIVSPAYFVCKVDQSVHPRFLHHLLRSGPYIAAYAALSKGIRPNQWDLPFDEFRRIDALLPPVNEQRRIADFLDAASARIDGLIRLREELDVLLDEHLDAEIATTISAQGEPWVPLRRIMDRWIDYRGATPEKTTSGVVLVTAGNIKRGGISFEKAREFISRDDYHDWMRRGLPQRGDVLLTTEAPLGEVAQVEDDRVALAQRVILLRPNPSLMRSRWLYWALRSRPVQASLFSMATGSTALGIKADRLRSLQIPTPSLETQAALASKLDESMRRRELVRPLLRRQVALLSECRQALITAAVTGEIDVPTAQGAA